jgi:hypothetical protein
MATSRMLRKIRFVADLPPSPARDQYLNLLAAKYVADAERPRVQWWIVRILTEIWEGLKIAILLPIELWRKS